MEQADHLHLSLPPTPFRVGPAIWGAANKTSTVLYNDVTIGEAAIAIIGANNTIGLSVIPGNTYTVVLQAGEVPASIAQTALIPSTAQSIIFVATPPYCRLAGHGGGSEYPRFSNLHFRPRRSSLYGRCFRFCRAIPNTGIHRADGGGATGQYVVGCDLLFCFTSSRAKRGLVSGYRRLAI